ncbi:MAG: IS66 family insertion sequence element accessory protein TnpB [Desulfobacterales bacterium]|nr:IS66 family insertion sequence element accessory protein TnpB [Desulfobacterales bacterium]
MFRHDLKVYLAPGATDLRKSIDGLSILVENRMELNPFSGYLFAFCNRKRTTVKILYWDRNGFSLWMKRLESQTFQWPDVDTRTVSISTRELNWLLDGLALDQKRAHRSLQFSCVS